ncbi:MAG: aromatic amino acid transport family protein [PVC group bacterium]
MEEKTKLPVITASFIILGNCLGVGVLALPVKYGLAGFVPALIGIFLAWFVMMMSAFVIAYRISQARSDTFDIPWFFRKELGTTGKWLAIACNLILLYGVLTAYLSGMSTMIDRLFHLPLTKHQITVIYFALTTSLVLFGVKAYRKGNALLIGAIWICFILLVVTGVNRFTPELLTGTDWRCFPIGLPIAVSAFHFHNIIPTISRTLRHDFKATRKAIFIGIFLGLIINVIWVTIVLGTLPRSGTEKYTIEKSYWHELPANVPMSELLGSRVFLAAGFIFAILSVTASYMANGTGLHGFIRNLTNTYLKTDNKVLIGLIAFLPPLIVALIYPDIFLSALDIVGGVGESVLFVALPGLILTRVARNRYRVLVIIGYLMFITGCLITAYAVADKIGLIDLVPPFPSSS